MTCQDLTYPFNIYLKLPGRYNQGLEELLRMQTGNWPSMPMNLSRQSLWVSEWLCSWLGDSEWVSEKRKRIYCWNKLGPNAIIHTSLTYRYICQIFAITMQETPGTITSHSIKGYYQNSNKLPGSLIQWLKELSNIQMIRVVWHAKIQLFPSLFTWSSQAGIVKAWKNS